MANQSRPDEDYVIAAVHVEAEVRAILRSLSVTINMIAGVPFQWLTITHRLQLKNNRVMLGDRIVVSQRYRCRRDAARTKVQSLLCCFAPRKNPGTNRLCWNGRWILLPVHRGRLFKSFRQRTIIATATIELLREMFARYGNQQWNANRQRHFPAVLPKPRIYTPATYIPQSTGQTRVSISRPFSLSRDSG